MGYGQQEIYTRWSHASLRLWTELFAHVNRPELFQKTGVLWTKAVDESSYRDTLEEAYKKCESHFKH